MASTSCNSTLDNQSEPQDSHGIWLSDLGWAKTIILFGYLGKFYYRTFSQKKIVKENEASSGILYVPNLICFK
jgi:hypothetical protein